MKEKMSDYDKLQKAKKDSIISSATTKDTEKEKGTVDNRVDPTEKRDLARLVDYYRLLLETFEKERVEYSNRLNQLKVKNTNDHKLDWETKRRHEEISELEQALYEASTALSNERKRAIHFANEIEYCKTMKKEDHRRILQLLQLAEPIEQTVMLYQGKRPEKIEKYSNFNFESGIDEFNANSNNVSIKRALSTKNKYKKQISKSKNKYGNFGTITPKKPVYIIRPSDEKQQILRTILLPNDQKTVEVNRDNEKLREEIEDLPGILINTLEESFRTYLFDPLCKKHNAKSKVKVGQISATTINTVNKALTAIKDKYTTVTSSEIASTYLNGQTESMKGAGNLQVKDVSDNLKGGVGGLVVSLELLCKDKKELTKANLKNSMGNLLTDAANLVVAAFSEHFGKNFIEKINRRIFLNGINPMVDFIKTKVLRLVSLLKQFLSSSSQMTDTMKNIVKEVFPQLANEFTNKVSGKVQEYAQGIINKLEAHVLNNILNSFINLIKTNPNFKGEFSDDVFAVIIEGISPSQVAMIEFLFN